MTMNYNYAPTPLQVRCLLLVRCLVYLNIISHTKIELKHYSVSIYCNFIFILRIHICNCHYWYDIKVTEKVKEKVTMVVPINKLLPPLLAFSFYWVHTWISAHTKGQFRCEGEGGDRDQTMTIDDKS
jgi:hypothetical protein